MAGFSLLCQQLQSRGGSEQQAEDCHLTWALGPLSGCLLHLCRPLASRALKCVLPGTLKVPHTRKPSWASRSLPDALLQVLGSQPLPRPHLASCSGPGLSLGRWLSHCMRQYGQAVHQEQASRLTSSFSRRSRSFHWLGPEEATKVCRVTLDFEERPALSVSVSH